MCYFQHWLNYMRHRPMDTLVRQAKIINIGQVKQQRHDRSKYRGGDKKICMLKALMKTYYSIEMSGEI